MLIEDLKQAILLTRMASTLTRSVTPFIWGEAGIGKSAAVAQVCKENRFGFIDFRTSQIEASELRGLPDKIKDEWGERVRYLAPSDMPRGHKVAPEGATTQDKASYKYRCPACDDTVDVADFHKFFGFSKRAQAHYCKGELFLDELPRAEDDTTQAAFQLVLDRGVGEYMLPDGWHVTAAGNFQEGGNYTQNAFQDKAWLDRFCHLTLSASDERYLKGWSDYVMADRSETSAAIRVVQFVSFDMEALISEGKGELGFEISPSPRSWEQAIQVLDTVSANPGRFSKEVARDVLAGLLGEGVTAKFIDFNIDVTPAEILKDGVTSAIKIRLNKLDRSQIVGLTFAMEAAAKKAKRTKEMMNNTLSYLGWLADGGGGQMEDSRDLAVSMATALWNTDIKKGAGAAVLTNSLMAEIARDLNKGKLNWAEQLKANPKLDKLIQHTAWGI